MNGLHSFALKSIIGVDGRELELELINVSTHLQWNGNQQSMMNTNLLIESLVAWWLPNTSTSTSMLKICTNWHTVMSGNQKKQKQHKKQHKKHKMSQKRTVIAVY